METCDAQNAKESKASFFPSPELSFKGLDNPVLWLQ